MTPPAIRWERRPAAAPRHWGRGRRTGRAWLLARTPDSPLVTCHVAPTPNAPAEPGAAFPVARTTSIADAKRKAEHLEALGAETAQREIDAGRWPDRRGQPAGPDARPAAPRRAQARETMHAEAPA